nr:ionotropic receptor 21a [Pachyrhinus yasumatsui]
MRCQDVVDKRSEKVVVVAKSSQWRVQEFLASENSQEIANLLVIVKSDKFLPQKQEAPYILYTHKLFVDALGSSLPVVLTSWALGNFSQNVSLFQSKIERGFSGHRFIVAVAHQPPYVIKKQRNENDEFEFDGIEVKLVDLLSKMFNFSTDFKESPDVKVLGSGEAVIKAVRGGNLNLGIGGIYITEDRFESGIFHWHGEDCASFITLASTALPRYRAIMGPFRWTVWVALIFVYLSAIFLFSYSDTFTLHNLIKNPEEMENMFWYVFGTFTNCFTFTGKKSWTRAEKNTTKLLVGVYWIFTIIITACYTGSIIAFVTLPIFPAVVDTVEQLLGGRYQTGMLDKGGWPRWFKNMTDKSSINLLKKVDYVPDVGSGLKNVTKAFFWPYALLASREELKYIVKTNFSVESKRQLLHISQQCFIPFKVGILLPQHSVYSGVLADGLQKILQAGLHIKIANDVEWNMLRTATGKLLAASTRGGSLKTLSYEDRALTLDDTQGMFLLLGVGFLTGGAILLSEIFGGCFNLCKRAKTSRASSTVSIPSNPRYHEKQTIRERTRSISLTEHQSSRSMSLISNEVRLDKSIIEEPLFGENLIHSEINYSLPCNKNSRNSSDEEDSSDSQVECNEEISKIFTTLTKREGEHSEQAKHNNNVDIFRQ